MDAIGDGTAETSTGEDHCDASEDAALEVDASIGASSLRANSLSGEVRADMGEEM